VTSRETKSYDMENVTALVYFDGNAAMGKHRITLVAEMGGGDQAMYQLLIELYSFQGKIGIISIVVINKAIIFNSHDVMHKGFYLLCSVVLFSQKLS
jgi:type II secretory pathway predicted ATPase ExeA